MKAINIRYYYPELHIGFENIQQAWLLTPGKKPVKLKTIIHQGLLTYRLPITGKRISYRSIKGKLITKQFHFFTDDGLLPF